MKKIRAYLNFRRRMNGLGENPEEWLEVATQVAACEVTVWQFQFWARLFTEGKLK